MLTLKETRFDEDRYLGIGSGRYLAYEEDGDYYYFSKEPQPMRGKPIEVDAPFGCAVEEVLAFAIDRPPHSVDFVVIGILYRFPDDGLVWVAGDVVGNDVMLEDKQELMDEEKGKMWLLPPLVFTYPKQKPQNLSKNQLLDKISKEAGAKLYALCERFRLWAPPNLDLSIFINSNSCDEDEQPGTSTWTMEQWHSSLENCATRNCSHCSCRGTNPTKVWSMEQLNSSIDNCAMGNCLHCQGAERSESSQGSNLVCERLKEVVVHTSSFDASSQQHKLTVKFYLDEMPSDAHMKDCLQNCLSQMQRVSKGKRLEMASRVDKQEV